MLGRSHNQDRPSGLSDEVGYDSLSRFGLAAAEMLYGNGAKLQYMLAPQNLTASNRPSDTNIGNMPVRVVVAQLAPQTQARAFKKTLSRSIVLRPGNQSLGGA